MSVELTTSECLNYAIGLSNSDCECFNNDQSIYRKSDSGIYLSDLEGLNLNLIDSASDCEKGGIWDLMDKSRKEAINYLRADIMALAFKTKKQRKEPFTGTIGQVDLRSNGVLNYSRAGVRIVSNNIVGGEIKIKNIGIAMSGSGDFIVRVMNSYSDTPISEFTISAIANQITRKQVDITIPMSHSDFGLFPNYYIIWDAISNITYKEYKAACTTCSGNYQYVFNEYSPTFSYSSKNRWSEFLMITGIEGDDISLRHEWSKFASMKGLVIDIETTCNTSEIICKNYANFQTNPIALAMAHAIRYKAGALLLDNILASSNINRFTMTDRESIYGRRNNYIKEYNSRVNWLSDTINYGVNDCIICNDYDDIIKTGILS